MFAAIHAIDNCLQSKSHNPPLSLLSMFFKHVLFKNKLSSISVHDQYVRSEVVSISIKFILCEFYNLHK